MMCLEPTVMEREARCGTVISEGGWFSLVADTLRLAHGATRRAKFVRREALTRTPNPRFVERSSSSHEGFITAAHD
jgi:hypothetical protein